MHVLPRQLLRNVTGNDPPAQSPLNVYRNMLCQFQQKASLSPFSILVAARISSRRNLPLPRQLNLEHALRRLETLSLTSVDRLPGRCRFPDHLPPIKKWRSYHDEFAVWLLVRSYVRGVRPKQGRIATVRTRIEIYSRE